MIRSVLYSSCDKGGARAADIRRSASNARARVELPERLRCTRRLLLRLKSLSVRNSSARALGSVRQLGEFLSQLSVALAGAMAGSGGVRTTSTTSSHSSAVGVDDRTLHSARAGVGARPSNALPTTKRTGACIFPSPKLMLGSPKP